MIILQIFLIPLIALLLLGMVFAIGTSGSENPRQSTWIDEDIVRFYKPDSAQTTIHLLQQAQKPKKPAIEKETVNSTMNFDVYL